MGEYYAYSSDIDDLSDSECLRGSPISFGPLDTVTPGYRALQEPQYLINTLKDTIKKLKKENGELKNKMKNKNDMKALRNKKSI